MATVDELLIRLDATTIGLRQELAKADRQVGQTSRNIERHVSRLDRSISGIGSAMGTFSAGLIAAFGLTELTRDIIDTTVQFEKLDVRLRRLTGSEEEYAEAQEYLRNTAQSFSVELASLTEQYSRLLTLQNSGLVTQEQARSILEGFADVAAATGASTGDLNNVMYGLSQALSAGVVRAEELNQVTEPLPGLLQKLDEASGQVAGGFRRMVVDGKVTSDFFATTLIQALQSYSGAAAATADTVGASWIRLGNSWTELKRTLGSGLSDPLAGFIDTINRGIRRIHSLANEEISVQIVAANKDLVAAENVLRDIQERSSGSSAYARALEQQAKAAQVQVDQLRAKVDGLIDKAREHARRVDELEAKPPPPPQRREADLSPLREEIEQNKKLIAARKQGDLAYRTQVHLQKILNDAKKDGVLIEGDQLEMAKQIAASLAQQDVQLQNLGKSTTRNKTKTEAERELEAIQGVIEGLRFEEEQLGRTSRQQEIYNALQAAGIDETHDLAGAVADAAISLEDMRDRMAEVDGALEDLMRKDPDDLFGFSGRSQIDQEIRREIAANNELIAALERGDRAYRIQANAQQILNQYRSEGIDITAEVIAQANGYAETLTDQEEKLRKNTRSAEEYGHVISTAFEDAVVNGEELDKVLGSLLKSISQIILRTTVTKPLEDALTGFDFGGFFGGIFKGLFSGGSSGLTRGIGDTTGAGGAGFSYTGYGGPRASGGSVRAGNIYRVGERGVEGFIPWADGTIVPNSRMGDASIPPVSVPATPSLRSGATDRGSEIHIHNTWNVDASGADPAAIARLERSIAETNRNMGRVGAAKARDVRLRDPLRG